MTLGIMRPSQPQRVEGAYDGSLCQPLVKSFELIGNQGQSEAKKAQGPGRVVQATDLGS